MHSLVFKMIFIDNTHANSRIFFLGLVGYSYNTSKKIIFWQKFSILAVCQKKYHLSVVSILSL